MTSIPAGPGNTAQPAFRLTYNHLERITEQAIVELAANPYLLCEEAAAKAMFAKAAERVAYIGPPLPRIGAP